MENAMAPQTGLPNSITKNAPAIIAAEDHWAILHDGESPIFRIMPSASRRAAAESRGISAAHPSLSKNAMASSVAAQSRIVLNILASMRKCQSWSAVLPYLRSRRLNSPMALKNSSSPKSGQ